MFIFTPNGSDWGPRSEEQVARTLPGAGGLVVRRDALADPGSAEGDRPGDQGAIGVALRGRQGAAGGGGAPASEEEWARPGGPPQASQGVAGAVEGERPSCTLREIVSELAALKAPDPEDLHLRALIEYRLERDLTEDEKQRGDEESWPKHFDDAIGLYEKRKVQRDTAGHDKGKDKEQADPMYALCLADRGHCKLRQSDFIGAVQDFQAARGAFLRKDIPRHFEIYTFCREAERTARRATGTRRTRGSPWPRSRRKKRSPTGPWRRPRGRNPGLDFAVELAREGGPRSVPVGAAHPRAAVESGPQGPRFPNPVVPQRACGSP